MKKIIAILLVAVMALSMAACGGGANGDVTYAIVCKDASNPYMLRMISGFEAACEKLGVKSVTKSPETATVDGQIQIVNELIAQGVKGIAIAANDAAALEATIKTATDAGIVVVTLDSDTKGSQMFVNQAGVEQVAQVRAGKAHGGPGDGLQIHIAVQSIAQIQIVPQIQVQFSGNDLNVHGLKTVIDLLDLFRRQLQMLQLGIQVCSADHAILPTLCDQALNNGGCVLHIDLAGLLCIAHFESLIFVAFLFAVRLYPVFVFLTRGKIKFFSKFSYL